RMSSLPEPSVAHRPDHVNLGDATGPTIHTVLICLCNELCPGHPYRSFFNDGNEFCRLFFGQYCLPDFFCCFWFLRRLCNREVHQFGSGKCALNVLVNSALLNCVLIGSQLQILCHSWLTEGGLPGFEVNNVH